MKKRTVVPVRHSCLLVSGHSCFQNFLPAAWNRQLVQSVFGAQKFLPTGSFLLLKLFACSLEQTACTNCSWSAEVLSTGSSLLSELFACGLKRFVHTGGNDFPGRTGFLAAAFTFIDKGFGGTYFGRYQKGNRETADVRDYLAPGRRKNNPDRKISALWRTD